MTKVEMIERDIESLSSAERAALRSWFASFDAQEWDQQIEADVEAGRMDAWAEAALAEHREGKTWPL